MFDIISSYFSFLWVKCIVVMVHALGQPTTKLAFDPGLILVDAIPAFGSL